MPGQRNNARRAGSRGAWSLSGAAGNARPKAFVLGVMGPSRPRSTFAFVAAVLMLAACDPGADTARPRDPSPTPSSSDAASPSAAATPSETEPSPGGSGAPVFLVWAPGGLPDEALRAAGSAGGVRHAPVITGGTLWMDRASAGKQPPQGYSVPLEAAFVSPESFAHVVPHGETIPVLDAGEAVMADTAHAIRGRPEVPFTVRTDARSLRITGLVADEAAAGFEVVAAGSAPEGWGARYTIASGPDVTRDSLRRAVSPHVDGAFRVRAEENTPFLRHADAVHPPMLLKERFGEFAARPLPDGRLDMHPAWVKRNITEEAVATLGRVSCHRTFLEQVKDALRSARDQGLGRFIDRGSYAGCFSPRFILSDPSSRLSSHAWGAAFDFNVDGNAYGAEPAMDPRLVRHMEEWGFFWGGRWMIPDGMHFEWARVLD